jgi:hypothetical protein
VLIPNTVPISIAFSCGEVLSLYGHCWNCHHPPMDLKQDVALLASPPKLTSPAHEHAPKQHQLHS